MKASIQADLAKLKQGGMPAPLILNDKGQQVDETGQVIQTSGHTTTLKINEKRRKAAQQLVIERPDLEVPMDSEYFDPRLMRGAGRKQREGFRFVREGTFAARGEALRAKARFREQLREAREFKAQHKPRDEDIFTAKGQAMRDESVPDVEWWDHLYIQDYSQDISTLDTSKITHLIQHPVPTKPPIDAPELPPQPLRLTPREIAKLRRQRKAAAEKEKQDKIRLRVIEPPPPRITMSNFMRVLGAEAYADPTKAEAIARQQIAQRQQDHLERNEASKLTPAERRMKKLDKMNEDETHGVTCAVFRVIKLNDKKHRYKVETNARQFHLTGTVIIREENSLIIVEGGPKAISKYEKLLLRRIDWNSFVTPVETGDDKMDDDDDESDEESEERPPNACHLVWKGVIERRRFNRFGSKPPTNEDGIRRFLRGKGAEQYWDMLVNFEPADQ